MPITKKKQKNKQTKNDNSNCNNKKQKKSNEVFGGVGFFCEFFFVFLLIIQILLIFSLLNELADVHQAFNKILHQNISSYQSYVNLQR